MTLEIPSMSLDLEDIELEDTTETMDTSLASDELVEDLQNVLNTSILHSSSLDLDASRDNFGLFEPSWDTLGLFEPSWDNFGLCVASCDCWGLFEASLGKLLISDWWVSDVLCSFLWCITHCCCCCCACCWRCLTQLSSVWVPTLIFSPPVKGINFWNSCISSQTIMPGFLCAKRLIKIFYVYLR